jgi:hypothetical protein
VPGCPPQYQLRRSRERLTVAPCLAGIGGPAGRRPIVLEDLLRRGAPSQHIAADSLNAMRLLVATWHKAVVVIGTAYSSRLEQEVVGQLRELGRRVGEFGVRLRALLQILDPYTG